MSVTGSSSEASKKKRQGRAALGCFLTLFLVIGLAVTFFMFVVPVLEIVAARNWRPTPCTILKSGVERHRGSKSSTYSIEVEFEYFIDDQRYVSSRYKFMGGSSSGYQDKKDVADKMPPGSAATCYVNRRDPADAVLERGFTGDILFGLFPMIFAVAGGGGLYGVFIRKPKNRDPAAIPGLPSSAPAPRSGPATLKASASPGGRLGCSLGIALIWNGIVSIFFMEMVNGWLKGRGDGCMTLFVIPFTLVGLGLIVLVIYYFLALFNPRPLLKIAGGSAALGEAFEVEWETSGSVDRVKSFTITLEGREEATYRRGTSTATDKGTFARIEIAKSPRGRDLRRGKAKVSLPADSMHTFQSSNNKILWSFHINGDIPKWPDVKEEYPFEVLPQRLPPGGKA